MEFAPDEEASAFRPLEWFGPEVTGHPRYTHRSIGLRGLDAAPEIPLSDAALNSLIDTLDGHSAVQARTSSDAVAVNLDEIEDAMMRDMERTLPKGKPA
ncbi:hypothetical protein [Microvirga sp. TS319]|uniref:hypothetical protein n=1 Tax=Microvirga sp. TS319 TaxID=3241165 RepID=UPI00351A8BB7